VQGSAGICHPVAVTTEIRPGFVLADRFRIRDRLGHGGTAEVFLAEDCVLCRDVAIKRLHPEGSEADIRRFRREARLGAAMSHPNLVTVFDTLSVSEGLFIVMEYVRGRALADLIPAGGMDPRRLLEILRPVASALDYAHQHGVVHRDVKPANILIGEDRTIKLVDLGTATAGHLTQITAENEVMGTLPYIAPERLSGESVGEPASDVYSLAVVAFEALTGRTPHRADSPGELLDKAVHGPPPDLLEEWPQASPRLGAVLAQGINPDPDRRQHTAGAFVRDLEAALTARAQEVRPHSLAPTAPITPPTVQASEPAAQGRARPFEFEPRRRRPRWLVPAVVCACLLVAGGVWLAIAAGGGESGTGARKGQAANTQEGGPTEAAAGGQPAATTTTTTSSAASPAVAASSSSPDASVSGAQLNEEGYALIQQGRYAEAVPVLRKAVAAFPRGTTDINYAYALFNLGHALRMAGHPEKAIPILERRLEIPDQTATVQGELDAARAEAAR
jgi:eukaryotic-like serine/threonine-protein kinase